MTREDKVKWFKTIYINIASDPLVVAFRQQMLRKVAFRLLLIALGTVGLTLSSLLFTSDHSDRTLAAIQQMLGWLTALVAAISTYKSLNYFVASFKEKSTYDNIIDLAGISEEQLNLLYEKYKDTYSDHS